MSIGLSRQTRLIAVLLIMGAAWGLTQPLGKIAVSEGYRHFGILFWQSAIAVLVLGVLNRMRGNGLPLGRAQLRLYGIVALTGNVIPGAASYQAAVHLPAGVMAIVLSLIPMMAFPIALILGVDRFSWKRLAGLSLGLTGVVLLVAPEQGLPNRGMVAFIPLALIAPFFYALEGNIVARWGLYGLDPVQVLLGASILAVTLTLPLALLTGNWINPVKPWGGPDLAIVIAAGVHIFAYTVYVWMVGQAGAVFAAQVSYLVTGFGVLAAMVILHETYSGWVWLALGVMLAGLFLVQPRPYRTLAVPQLLQDDQMANRLGR